MELLARREHSSYELSVKLRQRGYALEQIESVMEEFRQQSFLSDERFAQQYIDSRMQKGYGPLKIEQELKERGVDSLIIQQSLQSVQDEWLHVIQRIYNKRFPEEISDTKDRLKRMRHLNQRGFTSEQIRKVIDVEDYV